LLPDYRLLAFNDLPATGVLSGPVATPWHDRRRPRLRRSGRCRPVWADVRHCRRRHLRFDDGACLSVSWRRALAV